MKTLEALYNNHSGKTTNICLICYIHSYNTRNNNKNTGRKQIPVYLIKPTLSLK